MTDEAKAARRAYLREWRKANPERVRKAQERFWLKKAAALRLETAEDPKLMDLETRAAAPAEPHPVGE